MGSNINFDNNSKIRISFTISRKEFEEFVPFLKDSDNEDFMSFAKEIEEKKHALHIGTYTGAFEERLKEAEEGGRPLEEFEDQAYIDTYEVYAYGIKGVYISEVVASYAREHSTEEPWDAVYKGIERYYRKSADDPLSHG